MSKILVVDDDLVVLATVSMGLRQAGYQVLQVDSGELAIQVCRREKPDLAILDMRMPGMSGIDVAQILKKEIGIPFIFLSAFGDKEIVDAATDAGALGYLVKPVEVARIVPAIEVALARAEDLVALGKDNADLAIALKRNREIDIAVGLVMARQHLSRTEAFEALRRYARGRRCKIVEAAQQLISGEVTLLRS
jgi:response regulator NasT